MGFGDPAAQFVQEYYSFATSKFETLEEWDDKTEYVWYLDSGNDFCQLFFAHSYSFLYFLFFFELISVLSLTLFPTAA